MLHGKDASGCISFSNFIVGTIPSFWAFRKHMSPLSAVIAENFFQCGVLAICHFMPNFTTPKTSADRPFAFMQSMWTKASATLLLLGLVLALILLLLDRRFTFRSRVQTSVEFDGTKGTKGSLPKSTLLILLYLHLFCVSSIILALLTKAPRCVNS